MKKEIDICEFKSSCLRLLDESRRTRKEIVITKRGRSVARLLPADNKVPVLFGRMKGSGEILGDLISPVEAL